MTYSRLRLVALTALLALASFTATYAQQPACVSSVAVRPPERYRAAVERARTIICTELLPHIPGVQVAVAVDGKIVWSEGFGYADLERRLPVSAATQFRIGSVSKSLTGDAVALLVHQGKLDLDAPVQKYVPSFPVKPWPVTTRELAGHTAGVRHYRGDEFLLNKPFHSVTEGLAIFANDSLLFAPGTRFSYSTYGWNLVSAVVEGASGQDFLSYMSRNVFRPLRMVHTAPDRVDSLLPDRTAFYDADSTGAFHLAPPVDNSYKWAGGGFVSTAEDLVTFGSAHLAPGARLAQASLDLLMTSQHTSDGKETGYGVGWFIARDSLGHRYVFHGGGSVGGTTAFSVDLGGKIAFALCSNLTDAQLAPARVIPSLFDQ
jgi:CubicO group peptidase (beta-lactamase class C family)